MTGFVRTIVGIVLIVAVLGIGAIHPRVTVYPSPLVEITPEPSPTDAFLSITGRATYYDASRNGAWYTRKPRAGSEKYHQEGSPYPFYGAASPALRELRPFRWGDEPYRVIVSNLKTHTAIVVWIVDECACVGGGVIDLSPLAWKTLGEGKIPFSRGVQDVRVEILP
jgi:hypothetical protein